MIAKRDAKNHIEIVVENIFLFILKKYSYSRIKGLGKVNNFFDFEKWGSNFLMWKKWH